MIRQIVPTQPGWDVIISKDGNPADFPVACWGMDEFGEVVPYFADQGKVINAILHPNYLGVRARLTDDVDWKERARQHTYVPPVVQEMREMLVSAPRTAGRPTGIRTGVRSPAVVPPTISRVEFMRYAEPQSLQIGGASYEVPPQEFKSGSFGWAVQNQVGELDVGNLGKVPVGVMAIFTVLRSKRL